MKRKWKTNGLKRSIAVLMAAALVFTMQGSMGFSAEAGGTAKTETTAMEKVLFKSDFNNVTAAGGTGDGFAPLSNQMYPKKDGDNGYIYYAQSNCTIGILRLGHSYTNKSLTDYTPIKVVPGRTYSIEFDYRLKTYLTEAQQQQYSWPAADLTIGVAVGPANTSLENIHYKTGSKEGYLDKYVSWHKDIEVLAPKETKPDVDWTHKIITVTIPENCDVSQFDSLQLYATLGQRCGLHIDNIKVSTNELITSSELSYNDYSTAVLSSEGTRDDYNFTKSSLSALPDVDPLDSNNKTIGYKQVIYDKGAVYLGAKYAAGQEKAIEDAIEAEAGETYLVQYDYYTEGKVNSPAGLKMYLTVGKTVLDTGEPYNYAKNSISYEANTAQLLLDYAQNTDLAMSEWKRNNIAIITIPEGATFANGQYLMLYVTGGGGKTSGSEIDDRAHIYFDNIKVSKVTKTEAIETEDKVLFESNYDGVTHYDNCPDGQVVNNTDWYRTLAGQLFTQKIDGNGYLEYTQSDNTLGVIRLGHTYEQKNMTYTPITVTAGKTYMIEFDMRVNAAQWVVKSNATSTAKWPAQDLLMGVAVGPSTTSLNIAYDAYRGSNTADLQVFETLAANTKVVSSDWEGNVDGWVHRKWVYTVPEDCDLSTNNALQLFFAAGQRCAVSIDNIKVTEQCAGVNVFYSVDNKTTNTYNSDGNIPYNAMLDRDYAVKWYTDAAHTMPFISGDYERQSKLTTQNLYGVKDLSTIAFVKGDADGSGAVNEYDLSTLRNGLLGDAITYETRAKCNEDDSFDIKDLVRAARIAKEDTSLQNGLKIGNQELSSYIVVEQGIDGTNKVLTSKVVELREFANSDTNTNTINVKLDTTLANKSYVVKVEENSLNIVGQNADALITAIETVLGYVRAGVSMTTQHSTEFVYTGEAYTAAQNLVLSENFQKP